MPERGSYERAKLDKKTKDAAISIQNGSLAEGLKKNMKYTATGIIVGGCVGVLIATLSGQPRLMFAVGGAIIGGAAGRIAS